MRLTGFQTGRIAETLILDAEGNTTDQVVEVSSSSHTTTITTSQSGLTQSYQVETRVNGLPTGLTSFDGLSASSGYDSLHRLHTWTDSRGNTTTTSYHSGTGLVSSIVDGTSATLATFGYNGLGRRTWAGDAASNYTYYAYTARGELWRQWGSGAYPVEYGYDSYGARNTMSTYRSGTSWGNTTWPGGTGDTTTWHYDDASGVLTSKEDAAHHSVSFAYNQRGQTATRTWARGTVATYGYDENTGELTGITYSDSTPAVGYTYTRLGQLDTATDATGTRDFLYDSSRPWRLATEALSGFYGYRVLTRLYEGSGVVGRVHGFQLGPSAGSSAELEQDFGFTAGGRFDSLTSQRSSNSVSRTFSYGYWSNSRLVQSLSAAGTSFTLTRTYEDHRDLLTQIKTQWSTTQLACYDYTYNGLQQRSTAKQSGTAFGDYGAATFQAFTYNGRGELTAAPGYMSVGGSVTNMSQLLPDRANAYDYDPIGNRKWTSRTGASGIKDIYGTSVQAANALNQYETRENNTVPVAGTAAADANVVVGGSSALAARQGNAWGDEITVNNASAPWQGTVNVYAAKSGLVRTDSRTAFIAAALQSFTYDADGNLSSDGVWDYQYDAENRLIRMATTSLAASVGVTNRILTFQYDYAGRRVQKRVTDGGGTEFSSRRYLYDGWNLVAEYQAPGGSSIGSLLRSYTWGLDLAGSLTATGGVGALLQIVDHPSGNTYLPAFDGNGNVAALVNGGNGTLAAVYEYDPFGVSIRTEVFDSTIADQPFRFSTKFTDIETGLVYYGYRYYSPSVGRFINRDPIEEAGGLNLYGFAGNDPVNSWDYLGRLPPWLQKIQRWLKDKAKTVTDWFGPGSNRATPGSNDPRSSSNDSGRWGKEEWVQLSPVYVLASRRLNPDEGITAAEFSNNRLPPSMLITSQPPQLTSRVGPNSALRDGSGGANGNLGPDSIYWGAYPYHNKATLFILSPSEQRAGVMNQISSKANDGKSYLFDMDAWRESGLSPEDFIGNKLDGRVFAVAYLGAHGGPYGIVNPWLAALFDARTEEGRAFLGAFTPYLRSGGDLIQGTCYGMISNAQARANADFTGTKYWVGSYGQIFPYTVTVVPTTNNISDGYELYYEWGYWKVYYPRK